MMDWSIGRVIEIQLGVSGARQARIACPPGALPGAGQYLLAWAPDDEQASLATPVFPVDLGQSLVEVGLVENFLVGPSVPASWEPGTQLRVRGPLGNGFDLLSRVYPQRHLALAAVGESPACLLPLANQAAQEGWDITLFCDAALPSLPAAVEAYPLEDLAMAVTWASALAIDLEWQERQKLSAALGLRSGELVPVTAQVLIHMPMPCGGLAADGHGCGACAVPTRQGWKLACRDGPVFDLRTIEFERE